VDTFADYPHYILPLPLPIIQPEGYPETPVTIGEHILKRRIDLDLFQREVAEIIGVSEQTVCNWEHGIEPELRFIPKIIEFLGYIPFECPDNPLDKLRYYKKVNGLSIERLGALMNRDPEQLGDWFRGKHKPCKRNIESILTFLSY
jgi:transcriptional regulator with XRE-family HTH domain